MHKCLSRGHLHSIDTDQGNNITPSNYISTLTNNNAGTVNYDTGILTLDNFNPLQINNPLGILSIQAVPTTTIVSSQKDKIITLDNTDPNSISVNITSKV